MKNGPSRLKLLQVLELLLSQLLLLKKKPR
jgi:hypothetical protein